MWYACYMLLQPPTKATSIEIRLETFSSRSSRDWDGSRKKLGWFIFFFIHIMEYGLIFLQNFQCLEEHKELCFTE